MSCSSANATRRGVRGGAREVDGHGCWTSCRYSSPQTRRMKCSLIRGCGGRRSAEKTAESPKVATSRVRVKASPAFGRRRLHTNTDYIDIASGRGGEHPQTQRRGGEGVTQVSKEVPGEKGGGASACLGFPCPPWLGTAQFVCAALCFGKQWEEASNWSPIQLERNNTNARNKKKM